MDLFLYDKDLRHERVLNQENSSFFAHKAIVI